MNDVGRGTGRTTYAIKSALRDLKHENKKLPIVIHCPTLIIYKYIQRLTIRLALEQGFSISPKNFIYSQTYSWRGLENFVLITDHTIYEYGTARELRENYQLAEILASRMKGKK